MKKIMVRSVLAFLAFNFYSGCLIWAFQINTAYQFDSAMIRRLHGTGINSPSHWGWGNHYIWRLTAAVVATALAGVLAGAIARTRGGLTTAVSNLPSVAISIAMVSYLLSDNSALAYGDQTITIHTGMIVSTLVGIPLTMYVAYLSGEFGASIQLEDFGERTVLGIAGYHWVWIVVPSYLYAMASIMPIANFLSFGFLSSNVGLISGLINMALFATAIVSLLPLVWVFLNLKTPAIGVVGSLRSALINTGIILLGLAGVSVVQLANRWLLGRLIPFS
jgi:hypothetical protein